MSAPSYIQVQITFPTEESAVKVAEKLVANRLAACAQISGPIQSTYVWEGKTEHSGELLLSAKTKAVLFDLLAEAVREEHPYDCPQIVALPLFAGSSDYLAWLDEQTLDLAQDF